MDGDNFYFPSFSFVIRLVKSLFKDILISLHKPTLSIGKVLSISYGKDEGEEEEIEYEILQAADYNISLDNDNILIHITKEFMPDFEYHFMVTTLQTDGNEEDYQVQFEIRGNFSSLLLLHNFFLMSPFNDYL